MFDELGLSEESLTKISEMTEDDRINTTVMGLEQVERSGALSMAFLNYARAGTDSGLLLKVAATALMCYSLQNRVPIHTVMDDSKGVIADIVDGKTWDQLQNIFDSNMRKDS